VYGCCLPGCLTMTMALLGTLALVVNLLLRAL
jgi:hypothetical protein